MMDKMIAFVSTLLGCVYPALESCRAALHQDEEAYHTWITYWVVSLAMRLLQVVVELFVLGEDNTWYEGLKVVFIAWLVLPRFKGAAVMYHTLIHKYLEHYEQHIDAHFDKLALEARKTAVSVGSTVIRETSRAAASLGTGGIVQAVTLVQQTSAVVLEAVGPGRPTLMPMMDGMPARPPAQGGHLQERTWSITSDRDHVRVSPVGATPTQLLSHVMQLLDEGIFLHVVDQIRVHGATALHLVRLSADRRALTLDNVAATSGTKAIPLLSILSVRPHVSAQESLELCYAMPVMGSMRLTCGSEHERDTLLAGFNLMLRSVRGKFELGVHVIRKRLLQRALTRWSRVVVSKRCEENDMAMAIGSPRHMGPGTQ